MVMKNTKSLLIIVAVLCFFLCVGNTISAAPTQIDLDKDWQIGPLKAYEKFDQELANKTLGTITSVSNDRIIEKELIRTITFEHGFISVRGETILSIGVDKPSLETPRGIGVNSKIDDVIKAYGFPRRTKNNPQIGETRYSYERESASITFFADGKGKVRRIIVAFPAC